MAQLHALQEITLAYPSPPRRSCTLRDLLSRPQTRQRVISRPRQVLALLVHGDLHRDVFQQALLFLVVALALFLRHSWIQLSC